MKIARIDLTPVSVPYVHREVSSIVRRDGVTEVIVRVETDDGIVGWGEACSGADVVSVEAALRAMLPFVVGRDPWNAEAMRSELYHYGLWQLRPTTANYAWAGIDMALGYPRQGCRRAALPSLRRTSTKQRLLLLLPGARRLGLAQRPGGGWSRARLRHLLSEDRARLGRRRAHGRRAARGARARAAHPRRRQLQLERAGGDQEAGRPR